MSQKCRLCDGDGICIHERHARCTRCNGKGVVADAMDQDAVQYVKYACGGRW